MSVLLRRPATVPALFSRAVDTAPQAERRPGPWRRIAPSAALLWVTLALFEASLVQAAAAAVGVALQH